MTTLAVAAPAIDSAALLIAALAAGAAAWLTIHRWPKAGVLLWLFVIAFIPDWVSVALGGATIQPSVVAATLVLAALVPLHIPRLGLPDVFAGAFFAACIVPFSFGALGIPALFAAVAIWGSAFLLGRLLPLKVSQDWIFAAIAITLGIVGAAAVVEFLLVWNPFAGLFPAGNSAYSAWAPLQQRGGVFRSEWAFGHSIALGTTLAMGIPFAIASRLRASWRVLLVVAMVGGIAVTFSRSAMVSGVLALLLSIYALRAGISPRVRLGVLVFALVVVAALVPLVSGVLLEAGAEATKSADYRGTLLSLVPLISLSGTTSVAALTAGGESFFGQFNSVDSAVLLIGLKYGWIALALAVLLFIGAAGAALFRRGGPAVVAVVAVAPSLLTVALITQYAAFFWFVAGLAVYSLSTKSLTVVPADGGEGEGLEARERGLAEVGS